MWSPAPKTTNGLKTGRDTIWNGNSGKKRGSHPLSKDLDIEIKHTSYDNEGRYILCLATIEGYQFSLVCLYAPSDARLRESFFSTLSIFTASATSLVIMDEDFNMVLNLQTDREGDFI